MSPESRERSRKKAEEMLMDYDSMPAGREMDAMVAERVMGRECSCGTQDIPETNPHGMREFCGVHGADHSVPMYSTDISAAWEVFLNMADRPFSVRRKFFAALQEQARLAGGDLVAWPDVLIVLRNKMPEAICRAALVAAGKED